MDILQDNDKQNVRTRHIDIRLTEKEYETVAAKAAECGMTLSNYGRKLLQNHHPNKRLSNEEVQGLNSLSDARADLIRIQNVLKGKPDEIKRDISVMKLYACMDRSSQQAYRTMGTDSEQYKSNLKL